MGNGRLDHCGNGSTPSGSRSPGRRSSRERAGSAGQRRIVRITVSSSVTVPVGTGRQPASEQGRRLERWTGQSRQPWRRGTVGQETEQATVVPYRTKMRSFTGRVLTGTLLSVLMCLMPLLVRLRRPKATGLLNKAAFTFPADSISTQ